MFINLYQKSFRVCLNLMHNFKREATLPVNDRKTE